MKLNFKVYFFTAVILLGSLSPVAAAGWKAHIEGSEFTPESVIAVNKDEQKMFLLIHKSPIRPVKTFSCSTGKIKGDKLVEGDKKTPEGVYFTSGRRTGLKNYELYGDMAFPLDFPNPVDRIKGKTGYGIWIHGRGKKLVSRDTQGCVAIANKNISSLDKDISAGFPVVIGNTVDWSESGGGNAAEALRFEKIVKSWADSWKNEQSAFFDYYDAGLFEISENTSFKAFRKHKERIFKSTPWIDIELFNIKALQGPDYWVTWFDQFYRSRNYVSSTNKRLYWQKIGDKWKIVGVEFGPRPSDLHRKYLDRKTPAIEKFVEDWRESWLSADLEKYLTFYDESVLQGNRKGLADIREQKKELWTERKPSAIKFKTLNIKECPEGFKVSFRQNYKDSSGYEDTGRKVVVLRPAGESWRIIEEQWSRLR
ncbi:L,D-transpeptidase family protein [Maridesulfovibrio bastinii]|uniref:L,D-transpeptidase family protein n=1 Tax=Maridesulfovibrio bastinii TaxID=47157 RepID=UPI0003FC5461|nr:L,D-transpeptidase family protein [Maridesulfovibrio bastinii]